MSIQLKPGSTVRPSEIEQVRSDPNLVVKEGRVDLEATRAGNQREAVHHLAVDTLFYPAAAAGLLRFTQIPEAFAAAFRKAKEAHDRAGLYADLMSRGVELTYQQLISQPLGA